MPFPFGSDERITWALAQFEKRVNAVEVAEDEMLEAETLYRNTKEMEIAKLIATGTAPSRAEKDWVYNTEILVLRDRRNVAQAVARVRRGEERIAEEVLAVEKLRYQRVTMESRQFQET